MFLFRLLLHPEHYLGLSLVYLLVHVFLLSDLEQVSLSLVSSRFLFPHEDCLSSSNIALQACSYPAWIANPIIISFPVLPFRVSCILLLIFLTVVLTTSFQINVWRLLVLNFHTLLLFSLWLLIQAFWSLTQVKFISHEHSHLLQAISFSLLMYPLALCLI